MRVQFVDRCERFPADRALAHFTPDLRHHVRAIMALRQHAGHSWRHNLAALEFVSHFRCLLRHALRSESIPLHNRGPCIDAGSYALISDSKSLQELLQRLRRILPRNIPSSRVLLSSSIGLAKDPRGESQLPFRRAGELRQPRAIQSRQRSRRATESSSSCCEYILLRMSEPPQNDYEQKEELRFSTDGQDRSRLIDSSRCVIPLAARFGTLGGNRGALPLQRLSPFSHSRTPLLSTPSWQAPSIYLSAAA